MPNSTLLRNLVIRKIAIGDWLNLAASISVLIGIVFVGYELRQNNELAEAESVRELFNQEIERVKFIMQDDYLPLQRQSFDDPASLTDEEIERLDLYFNINMQHYLSIATMRDQYGLAQLSVETVANFAVSDFLDGQFGRGWFAANEDWINALSPTLTTAINQEFARVPVQMKNTWPSEIRSSVKQVIDDE